MRSKKLTVPLVGKYNIVHEKKFLKTFIINNNIDFIVGAFYTIFRRRFP